MNDERLFVYGTLRDPEVQRGVIGREVSGSAARLHGYKKRSIRQGRERYPILVSSSPEDAVDGWILTVSERELGLLDAYEGAPYRRVRVVLDSGEECWSYVQ